MPTQARNRPIPELTSPFSGSSPSKSASDSMPRKATQNISGGPNDSAMRDSGGPIRISASAPTMPPMEDE